jgi:hypothetical protein
MRGIPTLYRHQSENLPLEMEKKKKKRSCGGKR